MMEKLTITSYKDISRKEKLDTYTSYVSPRVIKLNQKNLYDSMQTINGSLPLTSFACGGKSTMEVELILDGTGAYATENDRSVKVVEQLSSLRRNTVSYNGSIHQPPFLELVWGSLPVFNCRAEDMDVNYKTFNSDGVPVQADVRLMLVEDVDFQLTQRQANKQSPDLFHYHEVGEKETLALISYQYYQDTSHLHLIARTNNLDNLYDCKPGTTLLIPPLKNGDKL